MIYIIILTWNGKKYLAKLFESLADLNFDKTKYKVVVVDSCSTDGSREYIENQNILPVKLIKLEKNLGFTVGNNIGMGYALKNGALYIVLLNQDILVEPNFLDELVKVANGEEQIGVVQPLILYYKNRDEINSWGNQLHYLGYGFSGGNHEKFSISNFQFPKKEITYASAAAVLYKAEMLKKIGLFDENIFSYHEDSDLCLRAKLAGYKLVLAKDSMVYHDYSFPTKKNKKRYFWMEKNRLYIILKFYKLKTLLLILPVMLFMDVGQIIFALKKGYVFEWLKSRFWFLINFNKLYRARREVQKNRQIGDRELTKNFASEIKYQELKNPLLEKIANPVMKFYWQIIKKFI